jgi:hypothetical protein
MATATLTREVTLKHRSNLGEEPEEVTFAQGQKVTVLKAWADRLLCKNEAGQLFNIPKDLLRSGDGVE